MGRLPPGKKVLHLFIRIIVVHLLKQLIYPSEILERKDCINKPEHFYKTYRFRYKPHLTSHEKTNVLTAKYLYDKQIKVSVMSFLLPIGNVILCTGKNCG